MARGKGKGTRPAATVFSGAGTDEQMAVDVYAVKDSGIVNKVFGSLNEMAYKAADAIKQDPYLVSDLFQTARAVKDGQLTKIDALDRIGLGLNSSAFSRFTQYGTGVLGNLATKVGLSPEITGKMKVAVNGTVNYLTTNNVMDRGLYDLTGDLLANEEAARFFDVEGEAQLLNGVFTRANQMGAYDILTTYAESGQYDGDALAAALISSSSVFVENGDFDGTDRILDHITPDQYLCENPNATKSLLKNFSLDDTVTPDQYDAKLTQMKSTLNKLDSSWFKVNLNGEMVDNYDVFSEASDDAVKVLSKDPELRHVTLTARSYKTDSAINLNSNMYGNSALKFFKDGASKVSDTVTGFFD